MYVRTYVIIKGLEVILVPRFFGGQEIDVLVTKIKKYVYPSPPLHNNNKSKHS